MQGKLSRTACFITLLSLVIASCAAVPSEAQLELRRELVCPAIAEGQEVLKVQKSDGHSGEYSNYLRILDVSLISSSGGPEGTYAGSQHDLTVRPLNATNLAVEEQIYRFAVLRGKMVWEGTDVRPNQVINGCIEVNFPLLPEMGGGNWGKWP